MRGFICVLVACLTQAGLAAAAEHVTVMAAQPTSPSVLEFGTPVDISFDYECSESALVSIVPFTNGQPTPADTVSESPLYPSGVGQGNAWFSVGSGPVTVDALQVRLTSTDGNSVFYQASFPVTYTFNLKGAVYNIVLDPPPAGLTMDFGESITVAYSYRADEAQGVRIFFQPYSGYDPAPGMAFGPSVTLPGGSGEGASYFTLTTEPAIVDRVRVQMWRANLSVLLLEAYFPVSYVFGLPTTQQPVSWGRLKTKRW